jgi:hypothetical protein
LAALAPPDTTNMKPLNAIFFAILVVFLFAADSSAQAPKMLSRTTTKTDRLDFGAGGTVAVIGAPKGSITVEGWSNREVEITAEIIVEGATEADLDRLSKVVGFSLEESTGRLGIISVGTNDKKYIKQVDKNFPKALMKNPYRIDYVIKVPRYTDLQIDGGTGDLAISGIDGALKVNYIETNAKLELVGGGLLAVFGKGDVVISVPTRSWRGRFADVQLATGNMVLNLPTGLNADFDASILRTGRIDNNFTEFKPRVRKQEFTETSIVAKSGTGGVPLKFSVGDGTMKILHNRKPV